MENPIYIFETVAVCINIFSVLVLSIGVLLCAKNLVLIAFSRDDTSAKLMKIQRAKINLGGFVLLGLEILIVADIIETIIRPSLNDILTLAAIVGIRTVISFFLNREIAEIRKNELEKNGAAVLDE